MTCDSSTEAQQYSEVSSTANHAHPQPVRKRNEHTAAPLLQGREKVKTKSVAAGSVARADPRARASHYGARTNDIHMAEAVDRSATAVSLDEGYLAWAEEELGVVIHHKLRVSSTPGREERGVFCEDDIPADTIVVSVPWEVNGGRGRQGPRTLSLFLSFSFQFLCI